MNVFLEIENLDGILILIISIMVAPAILLFIISGILAVKNKKRSSKILRILGVIYLIISSSVHLVIY